MSVQRWTGPVAAFEGGGFVAYGDYLELKRELERALAEARAERDEARRDFEIAQKAGFKAVDRAEAAEAALSQMRQRYEYLRTLNVPQFKALFVASMKEPFDSLVDAAIVEHAQRFSYPARTTEAMHSAGPSDNEGDEST